MPGRISDDRITVDDWYRGRNRRIETLESGDGQLLLEGQVQRLVNAMAAFNPPDSAEILPGSEVAEQVLPVLASAWQPAA